MRIGNQPANNQVMILDRLWVLAGGSPIPGNFPWAFYASSSTNTSSLPARTAFISSS
jgi:hypothetical protein